MAARKHHWPRKLNYQKQKNQDLLKYILITPKKENTDLIKVMTRILNGQGYFQSAVGPPLNDLEKKNINFQLWNK